MFAVGFSGLLVSVILNYRTVYLYECVTAGKIYSALVVNFGYLYKYLVAYIYNILNLGYSLSVEL